jgi:hypothetical protein
MTKIWKAKILGVGIMTPALTGLPHAAAASAVDIDALNKVENVGLTSDTAAIGLLQEGVLALTPAEKLKIGGGRIRLSENVIRSSAQKPQPRSQHGTDVQPRMSPAAGALRRPQRGFLSIRCNHSCHCSAYSGACC